MLAQITLLQTVMVLQRKSYKNSLVMLINAEIIRYYNKYAEIICIPLIL